jgi:hypothetical protein
MLSSTLAGIVELFLAASMSESILGIAVLGKPGVD